jgi:hypothetical protein
VHKATHQAPFMQLGLDTALYQQQFQPFAIEAENYTVNCN